MKFIVGFKPLLSVNRFMIDFRNDDLINLFINSVVETEVRCIHHTNYDWHDSNGIIYYRGNNGAGEYVFRPVINEDNSPFSPCRTQQWDGDEFINISEFIFPLFLRKEQIVQQRMLFDYNLHADKKFEKFFRKITTTIVTQLMEKFNARLVWDSKKRTIGVMIGEAIYQ